MNENQIRDKLISQLHLVNKNYEYINKEEYIPNTKGTRGFIDILAKDTTNNRLIIIEVKKTKAASREALHEVLKYLEGIKSEKLLKDIDIVLIIMAIEWEELLIPFSSFHKRCNCNIKGYKFNIDENYEIENIEIVEPLIIYNDRMISNQHWIYRFSTKEKVDEAIEIQKGIFKQKKINDYIFVLMKAPEHHFELEKEMLYRSFIEVMNGFEVVTKEEFVKNYPNLEYILYVASQLYNKEYYLNLVPKDFEFSEELEEFDNDTDLCEYLHYSLISEREPFLRSEETIISNPFRFQAYIEGEWDIFEIKKYGAFEKNELLTKKVIIHELSGSDGTNKEIYFKEIVADSTNILTSILEEIKFCLKYNLTWQRQIIHIFEIIKEKYLKEKPTIKIYIFNPRNILMNIYYSIKNPTMNYFPEYYIQLEYRNDATLFVGKLSKSEITPDFNEIKEKYFNDDVEVFAINNLLGEDIFENSNIVADIGLNYATYKIEINNDEKVFYKYSNYQFIKTQNENIEFMNEYFEENSKFIEELYNFIDKNYKMGGYFVFTPEDKTE